MQSRTSLLSPKIKAKNITLLVRSLSTMMSLYCDLVGLDKISQPPGKVELGHNQEVILTLEENRTLPEFPEHSAGLYHLAIVFKDRGSLASVLKKILEKDPTRFSGSSDHLVSEAFYFTDPEGNGVELYYDRDPASWVWQDGQIVMGSSYIDPINYIDEHGSTTINSGRRLGHVHLQVGSIEEAKLFYVDTLGFHITAEMPTALFISDGVYHHTLGMNVWQSFGVGQRDLTLGLKEFSLQLANSSDATKLKERLENAHVSFDLKGQGLKVEDPWENQIEFTIR